MPRKNPPARLSRKAAKPTTPLVGRNEISPKKTLWLCIGIFGGMLLLIEISAWIYDANTHFRFQLFKALGTMQSVKTPILAQPDSRLGWRDGAVFVRDPSYVPPAGEPYTIGGKVIPEARPEARQLLLGPGPNDTRGKIFILGESAAFGYPLPYSDSFGARITPEANRRGMGVLNAAEPAWSSGMLVPVAKRVVDLFHPKMLILYIGNNEWIHWLPESQGPNHLVIAILRMMATSRAIAYAEYVYMKRIVNTAHSQQAASDSQHELTGFDFALKHPLPSPPSGWKESKQLFLSNFETNLKIIIDYAKAANTRVILMTVPFCYKLSPAWKHQQPVALFATNAAMVQRTLDEARVLFERKDYHTVIERLSVALAREPDIPILYYLKAAALEELGQPREAENSYAQCREKMIGNLGSMLSINQVIARTAASTGSELIDIKGIFDAYEHNNNRCCNEDLIIDDCHPTPLGHQLIANEILHTLFQKH